MARAKLPTTTPKRPAHRPSSYSTDIAQRICSLVAAGSNLTRISHTEGFPAIETIYRWLKLHAEFSNDYLRAREDRGDNRNDRIDELSAQLDAVSIDVRSGGIDSKAAYAITGAIKTQIDALKWQAAHEAPKKYGDRLELAGDKDAPLVVSVAEIIRAKRAERMKQEADNKTS